MFRFAIVEFVRNGEMFFCPRKSGWSDGIYPNLCQLMWPRIILLRRNIVGSVDDNPT
jgi:hypothetical protein